jgi:hypothetical protein
VVWLLCSARLYGDRDYLEGVATDITELRHAKDSLEQSAAAHRTLVEQLLGRTLLFAVEQQQLNKEIHREKELTENILGRCDEGVVGFDRDFAITLWNPSMERFSGFPKTRPWARTFSGCCLLLQEIDEKTPILAGGGRRGFVDPDRPLKLTPAGPEGFYCRPGGAASQRRRGGQRRRVDHP